MGGLAKKIPITFATIFCAPSPFPVCRSRRSASKDEILIAAYSPRTWMYWVEW